MKLETDVSCRKSSIVGEVLGSGKALDGIYELAYYVCDEKCGMAKVVVVSTLGDRPLCAL